jgi:hypothetical protein
MWASEDARRKGVATDSQRRWSAEVLLDQFHGEEDARRGGEHRSADGWRCWREPDRGADVLDELTTRHIAEGISNRLVYDPAQDVVGQWLAALRVRLQQRAVDTEGAGDAV